MGRTVHRVRSHTAGIISAYSDGRHRSGELVEHRTPQKILPLAKPRNSWRNIVLCNLRTSSSIKLSFSKDIQILDLQLSSIGLGLKSTHLLDLGWPLYPANGAIGLSQQRLKSVWHAHAYLTEGDHYTLLNGAIDLSRQQLKSVWHAHTYLT
jgi:hypothetical protein